MHQPVDEKELAELVAGASGPLAVRGGGTRPLGHAVEGEATSLAGLSGITLYEPGALTLVAKSGTPVAEIEAALAAEGQMLPFEPMDHRALLGTSGAPTIGGAVAVNASGPRRVQAGACRDSLIGVRFVDGSGTAVKNGGRVMKNVTGYDLVKLMAGSHGTLGVLTEVSFKVLPKPEATSSLVIYGLDDAAAIRAMTLALASPYEVSGAAHWSTGVEGYPLTHFRLEGLAASVAYRTERLAELLKDFGKGVDASDDHDHVAARWTATRDAEPFAKSGQDVWLVSARPSEAVTLIGRLPADAFIQETPEAIYDWGGGRIWVQVHPGTDLRAALGSFDGHATLIRASEATKARLGVFHPEPMPLARMALEMRRRFDPRGILNPGRMG